jgi:DNA-binding Lrp family transcriptional regulator
MDELDHRLIALLRHNGRESAATLARKLRISRGTVQNRIARLLERGDIQGFTIRSRPEAEPGRVRAMMSIAVEGERSSKVVRSLKGFPEVGRIFTTNGRWDLVLELDTASLAEFSRALDRIRTIEGITTSETSLLLAEAP